MGLPLGFLIRGSVFDIFIGFSSTLEPAFDISIGLPPSTLKISRKNLRRKCQNL
jgi:hypothetical protein